MTLVQPRIVFPEPSIMAASSPWKTGQPQAAVSSSTWPVADLAVYVPVRIRRPVVVKKLALANGAAVSGNFDIGIYDAAGTRLVSTGATAQSGTNDLQVVDVTDLTLQTALYYFACVMDNTTGAVDCHNPGAVASAGWGVLTQQLAASGTLPATATWAIDVTNAAKSMNVVALLDTLVT